MRTKLTEKARLERLHIYTDELNFRILEALVDHEDGLPVQEISNIVKIGQDTIKARCIKLKKQHILWEKYDQWGNINGYVRLFVINPYKFKTAATLRKIIQYALQECRYE